MADIDGISFCQFTEIDVVRHPLVQRIVVAYERRDAEREAAREARENQRRQDHASRRGLLKMVGRRARLLRYVQGCDYGRYAALIKRLGIRR